MNPNENKSSNEAQDSPDPAEEPVELTETPEPDKEEEKSRKEKRKEKKAAKSKKPLTEVEKLQEQLENQKKTYDKQIWDLKKEVEDHEEKNAYMQAELANTRKHYIRQADVARNKSKIQVITSFTPLIESFEVALSLKERLIQENNPELLADFLKGFENIAQSFIAVFDSMKVKAIDDVNVPFDYKIHEVMMKMTNDNLEEDTVVQIIQKGLTMDGEVIRPAKVIISKQTPPPPPPEPEPTPDLEPTPESVSQSVDNNIEDTTKPEAKDSTKVE